MGAREGYLEAILDNIPVGIIFIDEKGFVIYKNKKIMGEMCDDINKTKILENPLVKKSAYFKNLKDLLEKGRPFKNVMWKKNNKFFSMDGISLPSNGTIIIMNDISERVYAEDALRENEEKYRILTENSPTGILMVKDGKCLFSNKRFGEITGYGNNISKKNFMDLVHTGDIKIIRKKMNSVLEGKKSSSCTIRLIRKDGKTAWIELNTCAVNYEGGKALLVNTIDITKKRMMENELKLSNKKMEEIIERERKFTEDISHYFFNPLCIAKGYIDLSMKEADPELKRKLEITRTAVDRVETVVKHVVMEGRIYE